MLKSFEFMVHGVKLKLLTLSYMPYMVKSNHLVHKELHKVRNEFIETSVSS